MGKDTLTVTDNRTGKQYEMPIFYGTYPTYGAAVRSADLNKIKVSEDDFGLMGYDPAFMNTASCKSTITHIDGDKVILRYRGYPIDQLAEKCTYLEIAYLLVFGELPTTAQLKEWNQTIVSHMTVDKKVKDIISNFNRDAHPMGMLVSVLGALSTFHPDSKAVRDDKNRLLQIQRLIAKSATLGAYIYRHNKGLPFVDPDSSLSFTGNFLNMMFGGTSDYKPNPVLEKAVEVLFILHADHEQNCGTNAMRSVSSSEADPYVSMAGAAAALYGPLHGGANEQVLRMLRQISSVDKIPEYVKRVKDKEVKLMGFGHRVYKNYDPRARFLKQMAGDVFKVTGRNPLLDMAVELERIALSDEYFISHKLYPNVDFYSGIIYEALKIPVEFFTVMFAIPRTSGWLAQWDELM
ncbi:MAG: citrate synthase, partial [Pseudomonadota bacterium]